MDMIKNLRAFVKMVLTESSDPLENISAENAEETLQALIDDLEDVSALDDNMVSSIKDLNKMLSTYTHTANQYHNGETVMQHTKWVLEDIDRLTKDKDETTKKVLKLVALLHDVGKAYTCEVQPDNGRHTFHGHDKESFKIAQALLAKHRESLGEIYQRVIDLVRLHDTFMKIDHERLGKPTSSTGYLKKLFKEKMYIEGHIDDLVTFTKADSARSKAIESTLASIESTLEDMKKSERQTEEKRIEKQRQENNFRQNIPTIRKILEKECPSAIDALPNWSAVNAVLGKETKYDTIKKIKRLCSEA